MHPPAAIQRTNCGMMVVHVRAVAEVKFLSPEDNQHSHITNHVGMIQLTLKESGVARLSLLHPTLDLYMSRIQSSLMSGIPTDLRRQIFVREPEICPQLRSGRTPPVPKIAIIAHLAWDHIQRIHTLRCGPSVHPIRKVRWQKVQALLSDKKKRMGRSYGFMQALAGEFRSRIVFIPTYSFQHFYLLAFLYTSSIDRS